MTAVDQRITSSDSRALFEPALWTGVTVLTIAATVVAPLAAYVLMISAFGLAHVVCEMRYCDERFGRRSSRVALALIGFLIGLIAIERAAVGMGAISSSLSTHVELGLGAVLASVAAFFMRERRIVGFLAALAIAAGAIYFPIETFVAWAWLHNLSPLAFVSEATEGAERRWLLGVMSIFFLGIPALVATGVFHGAALSLFGHDAAQAPSAFGAGTRVLSAFLPPGATISRDAALFSSAVLAQAMHYVAVIYFLPRLAASRAGVAQPPPLFPWPSWTLFALGIAGLSAAAFAVYAIDYSNARAMYGIAAAMHSWVELPVFLMALGGGFSAARK